MSYTLTSSKEFLPGKHPLSFCWNDDYCLYVINHKIKENGIESNQAKNQKKLINLCAILHVCMLEE